MQTHVIQKIDQNFLIFLFFLFTKFGINNGKYLEKYLDELIYQKTKIKHLTFLELYNKSNIHLKIGVFINWSTI